MPTNLELLIVGGATLVDAVVISLFERVYYKKLLLAKERLEESIDFSYLTAQE